MNERFFLMPKEKQNKILNAAFKVFAQNDYKKAPMSEIAAEGDISKALLFYYFNNKLELYMYLWEKTMKLTEISVKKHKVLETDDFFVMLERGIAAKCSLMRQFPFLYLFSMNAYYEKCPEVKEKVQKSFGFINQRSLETVLKMINPSNIREGFTVEEIYQEVLFASDGFLLQIYRSGKLDIDKMENDYCKLIMLWKKAYSRIGAYV